MCVPSHTDATLHMWPWDQFVLMSVRLSRLYPSFFPFSIDLSVCFSSNLISKSFHHSYTSRQKYYFYLVTHSFHLKRLYKMDTCSFSTTHTLISPQHLVPSTPQSVFVIPHGSSFHFASLYLSHITLKIEDKWAWRCDERKRVSLLGSNTHTHTHTICSAHLILEERKERACKQ